jgi:multiple sugar transport system ATP-binding protein
MASVSIDDVHKLYGNTEVLHGVSVDVPDGEFVVLVGPSGCGKSTLLRMIAGLEDVSAGTISIGDAVVNDVQPKHRDIAMVFQNYALYPHMTVAQNMGFSLRLSKSSKDEIERQVSQAAGILGLGDYLNRYPKQLSGGQRQRVAMGRAIVRNPKVFLFDEPLSNLDAQLRVQMRAELRALHRRLKTTMIYVTHDQIEAMTMADRIVVMRDGVVEQFGTPLEIFDRPNNLFVAGFIGSPAMNLIHGKIAQKSGACVFVARSGAELAVDQDVAVKFVDKDVVYGVRPEHLVPSPGEGGFDATILVLEQTGSETHVTATIGDDEIIALLRERVELQEGAAVSLTVRAGSSHLFDPVNKNRLT